MSERYPEDKEEPLFRIAARRAVRRARAEAETPQFGRLLMFLSSGAAGDALLALALAGSLFFSVPEAEARDQVALYLLLTVTPFAILSPLLARVLDHSRGSLKAAIVIASLGRGTLAWLLASRLDTLLLFPIAFGVLLLSRAALVVRGAILPELVPEGRTLVAANSSLSKASALAGILAFAPGLLLLRWPGADVELLFASLVYYLGAIPAFRLPAPRGHRRVEERVEARLATRALSVRQAIVATAAMRMLVGFLVFHLAFALRRAGLSTIGLGALLGSAMVGSLVGALLAPGLRRRLREEGILVLSLVVAGFTAIAVGRWFSVVAAGVLVFAVGIAAGAAKLAFDSVIQRDVPAGARGWAFARFESVLQLTWVIGGFVPLLIAIPAGLGVAIAGGFAIATAIVYMAGRRRSRQANDARASER